MQLLMKVGSSRGIASSTTDSVFALSLLYWVSGFSPRLAMEAKLVAYVRFSDGIFRENEVNSWESAHCRCICI